ncbi:MAG: GNAT family N-acetyltransferase [Candidatus Nealsonbacteria bacterium]
MNNYQQPDAEQSSTAEAKTEDEPPDSTGRISSANLVFKTADSQTNKVEPLPNLGSFFIASEIVTDINRCSDLWQELSPQKTLFDTWEFRYAFYLSYNFKPYFLLLKNSTENLALLPLWFDEDEKKYVWFGSPWQEEVRIFAKDPKCLPQLLSLAPAPLYLNALSQESAELLQNQIKIKPDQAKYVLRLDNIKNHEDYLMTLKKNSRHNLRKDYRRIERQNPKITINNFADLEKLIELAKKRFFQKGEEADWLDQRRVETFKQVMNLAGKSYQIRMITVKINGKTAGVDLICLFNNIYFTVKCGYNVAEFPGIGNFVNLFEIDDALQLGMKKIDFLQNNYQWKSRLFEAIPLFQFQK